MINYINLKKYWIWILSLSTFILSIYSCHNNHSSKQQRLTAGDQLIRQYCSSCHLPVYPAALDSITWVDHVLPAMAPKLGIQVWSGNQYYQKKNIPSVISYENWLKLVDFYKSQSPKKLSPKARIPLKKDWSVFSLIKPDWKDTLHKATTTAVAIDASTGMIYSCNATFEKLYSWNKKLQAHAIGKLPSAGVQIFPEKNSNEKKLLITSIGVLKAYDIPAGEVFTIDHKDSIKLIADSLFRPVEALTADFNKDGLEDWVVCSFGHDKGGLYLFQQMRNKQFKRITIKDMPGAEHAVIGDFNHDGWPDMMVLFAQAEEGIWLFLNNKKGGFTSKNLLKFPPEYGSTSFQLIDFNHDGKLDIVYTCGDNGDYSPILKPFHGVYIFINQGNWHFKRTYFYPINGCTKAIAADFDKDGDLDIATIAFFADFKNNPSESFIYFEQDKPMHFIPHAIPIHKYGRWICMDAGDIDHDGDLDIVLGNFAQGKIISKNVTFDWDTHLPIIVLKNNIINTSKP